VTKGLTQEHASSGACVVIASGTNTDKAGVLFVAIGVEQCGAVTCTMLVRSGLRNDTGCADAVCPGDRELGTHVAAAVIVLANACNRFLMSANGRTICRAATAGFSLCWITDIAARTTFCTSVTLMPQGRRLHPAHANRKRTGAGFFCRPDHRALGPPATRAVGHRMWNRTGV
jgi:hypothetical protein